jgi:hypothetical protein
MPFRADEWGAAQSWEDYLATIEEKADIWLSTWKRSALADLDRQRLAALPGPRRVLVLSEDWCGDAARSVPYLIRAVEAAPGSEVRVLDVGDRPETVDRYLSRGGRAIPVAIVVDEEGRDLGWWGPRPAALQTLLRGKLAAEGPPGPDGKAAFYAPIMRWYREDAGRAILDEFLLLLERGGAAS